MYTEEFKVFHLRSETIYRSNSSTCGKKHCILPKTALLTYGTYPRMGEEGSDSRVVRNIFR